MVLDLGLPGLDFHLPASSHQPQGPDIEEVVELVKNVADASTGKPPPLEEAPKVLMEDILGRAGKSDRSQGRG